MRCRTVRVPVMGAGLQHRSDDCRVVIREDDEQEKNGWQIFAKAGFAAALFHPLCLPGFGLVIFR